MSQPARPGAVNSLIEGLHVDTCQLELEIGY